MDLGIGDCFNARVAGNIANDDILGSMEFACKVAGAKVVLVMGHTSCGAIKGAIDNVQLGNLTGLLAKIRPAVEATQYQGERSAKQLWFCRRSGTQECRVDDDRHPSAAVPYWPTWKPQVRSEIVGAMYQHRNRAGRILRLTRHNGADLMPGIATSADPLRFMASPLVLVGCFWCFRQTTYRQQP